MNNWIQNAINKPGALRKATGTKEGKNIPQKKLVAKKGDSTLMKKRKTLAKTLAKLRKKK